MGFLDSFKKILGTQEREDRSLLSKKVQASPSDPQARQKLGMFLIRQGEVVEGLDQLARTAVLYEKDGFTSKAIAVLRQMVKHDSSNLDFQRWLIRLLAQEGLSGDARREMEGLAARKDLFPSDELKIDFFQRVSESIPKSPFPILLIVDILCARNSRMEAVSELEKAARTAPASAKSLDFIDRLSGLSMLAGDDLEILEPCGFLWFRAGRRDEGISLLSRVGEKAKEGKDADRVEETERVLTAIEEGWDPSAVEAFSFRDAVVKMKAQQEAQAPPDSPEPEAEHEHLPEPKIAETEAREEAVEDTKMVHDALGRLKEKVEEEIGDSDLEARYNLGIAYKEMGLQDEAIEEFRISRKKPELFVGASSLLSDSLAEKGDFDAAVMTLSEVLASESLTEAEKRDVLYHKAQMLLRGGREREAMDILLSIYRESPDYRDVRQLTEEHRG